MAYRKLGELLIAAGMITQDELNRGLSLQQGTGKRLGEVLIENKIISENELIEALQLQLGVEYVDLSRLSLPAELAQLVPKNLARQYQVVPVKTSGDELYLAMTDPLNFYALEDVRKAARKKVVPMVSHAEGIDRAIQVLYGNEGASRAIEEMKREAQESQESHIFTETAFVSNQLGEEGAAAAPTIRLVNSIVERAVTENASDIHLEPHESEMLVRMRIDGIMHDILTVPRELQNSVIARIKIMAGMDIAEKRVPQDGRFNVKVRDRDIDLRISTLPTVYGETIVARLLDKTGGRITKESIGLGGQDLEKYEKLLQSRSGVVLIVGPTGSGKTTTMYAMIGDLNTREVNLVTLEDPVEYNIDGVSQVQINEKVGLTFAGGLRAILRQDPDIIAVGEIRDGETADIAMRAAITGHMVLSTVHTNDALGTVERLEDIGVEPYLVASAVRGIISQRLVRRICPDCREEYTPDAEELQRAGFGNAPGLKLYRGRGCPNCFGTGYRGRTGVFEMLEFDGRVRRMIAEKKSRLEIEEALRDREKGHVTLWENAQRLVLEGVTTAQEMTRIINEEDA